jgi:hypothetical protein
MRGSLFKRKIVRPATDWFERLGVQHPVVRYMLVHWALGIGAGVFCAASLLWINPLGIRDLMFRSPDWPLFLMLLFVSFAATFGGLVCGAAVMFPEDREKDEGGHRAKEKRDPALAMAAAKKN